MPAGSNLKGLRIGVIGLGGISRSQHLPHWHSCPHARLVALADTAPAARELAAAQYPQARVVEDWEALIADPELDVIDITTPNRWHAPMALAALNAGKHVLCEKPMAGNALDAARMLATARERGKKLMINHVFRFQAGMQSLRQWVEDGQLGAVYHAQARWVRRRGAPLRPTFISKELALGGPVIDLGIHMLDLVLWLLGHPQPTRVSGQVGRYLADEQLRPAAGETPLAYEVEDFGAALIHFADGMTLALDTSWLGHYGLKEERFVQLLGSRGSLRWPENQCVSERNGSIVVSTLEPLQDANPFQTSIHRFARAIVDDLPEPVPPENALVAVQLAEAIYRSAAEGREIVLGPSALT